MHQGTTTAPLLLTEADLIEKMDKNGIGSCSVRGARPCSFLVPAVDACLCFVSVVGLLDAMVWFVRGRVPALGTDATIAQHIETIKKRAYVELVGPARTLFAPTPLGAALVKAYQARNIHTPTRNAHAELF